MGKALLGKSEAAHQVSEPGIGAKRVQRGIANDEEEFAVSVRIGLLQIFESLIAVSSKRECRATAAERSELSIAMVSSR